MSDKQLEIFLTQKDAKDAVDSASREGFICGAISVILLGMILSLGYLIYVQ